jgi:hypothetical protein
LAVEKFDINAAKKAVKSDKKDLNKTQKVLQKARKTLPKGHGLIKELERDELNDISQLASSTKYLQSLEQEFAKQNRHKK